LCVRFTARMVRIDAFKTTAFKLHNVSGQRISPEEAKPSVGQMKQGTSTMEAFLEVAGKGTGATDPISYRVGYRCVETGETVCAIELPASIVDSTILARCGLVVMTTPDGYIVSTVRGVEGSDFNDRQPIVAEPIDAFIARSLNSDNLRLEEATVADLEILLQRLNHSTSLVSETIGKMAINQMARSKNN
jgi:hypothetical protein